MATIDYSNYLDQQNQWVTSLVQVARDSDPEMARELAEIVADSLHRMLDLARSHSRKFTLPIGHYTEAAIDASCNLPIPHPGGLNS